MPAKKPTTETSPEPAEDSSPAAIIKHPTVTEPPATETTNDENKATEDRETAPVLISPSAKKLVIQPISHDDAPPTEAPAEEPVPESESHAIEVKINKAAEPSPSEVPQLSPKVEEAEKPLEVPLDKATVEGKPPIDDEKEADERSAKIASLVASGEYFLPIETTEQRRSKRSAILGSLLILALLAAWYNVSLDANLLPNTYKLPHTSFFSAK